MPKSTVKTFESPYFLRVESSVVAAWLETGLRKPSANVQNLGSRERNILEAWQSLSNQNHKASAFSVNDLVQALFALNPEEVDEEAMRHAIKVVVARWAHCGVVWREAAAGHEGLPFKVERGMVYRLRSHEEVLSQWKGSRKDTQDNQALWRKERKTGVRITPKAVEKERANIEATLGLVTDYVQPANVEQAEANEEARYPLTLALVTQLIERCVRPTVRQNSQSMESTIVLAGEQIKATSGQIYRHWERGLDFGIMTADDAQLLLIIMMRAASGIEQDLVAGRPPVNRQSLDLKHITQMISNGEANPNAYVSLQKGMARILNTAFALELKQDGEFASKLAGATGNPANSRVRFQLLENPAEGRHLGDASLRVGSEEWVPSSGMRYFSFSLHPLLWQGLLEGQGLGVHPQLVSERSGLLHKVYYHLRYHSSLERSYVATSEQLMHRTHMVFGKNMARSRIEFSKQLWQGIRLRALQHSLRELPEELEEPIVVQFYDLNLRIEPSDIHKGGLMIEARHSQETLDIIRQNSARMARIKELAALSAPTSPTYSAPLLSY